jgi:predicted nucleic acid-binding protein
MTVVVDASVACKWFFEEERSDEARKIVAYGPLLAPDLIVAEVTNVAWQRVIRGEIGSEQATAAVAGLIDVMDQFVPETALAESALAIAQELNNPAYDCFYVALAETRNADLVTDDRTLLSRAKGSAWEHLIKPLSSY